MLLGDWTAATGTKLPQFWLPGLDGSVIPIYRKESRATLVTALNSGEISGYATQLAHLASLPSYASVDFKIMARDGATTTQVWITLR